MKLNKLSIAVTLIASSSIFAAVAFNGSQMPEKKQPGQREQVAEKPNKPTDVIAALQQVAVLHAELGNYTAEVVGYGEAKSRYELDFSSEISGRITDISGAFDSGKVVKKGTLLATVDSTSYQQALTLAKSNVAQAELDYLEEQRLGEQAKSEWKRSGLTGEPDSPLVLRGPQLAQVAAALENAKLELKKAQQDMSKTRITAPFDALVVTRDIDPGSYVQTGTQVATLFSVDEVEVSIPLSESQWQNLPNFDNDQLTNSSWAVKLQSSDGTYQWQGHVGRVEQHLSQDSRQRSLIVVVEKPLEQQADLYPGTFVQATISGKALEQLWQLPASSLSQKGELWFVDSEGNLGSSVVSTEFEKDGYLYVDPNSNGIKESALVVKRPLSSFQSGVKVQANVEG